MNSVKVTVVQACFHVYDQFDVPLGYFNKFLDKQICKIYHMPRAFPPEQTFPPYAQSISARVNFFTICPEHFRQSKEHPRITTYS